MCCIVIQTCQTGMEIVGKEAIVLGRSKIVVSPSMYMIADTPDRVE